MAQHGYIAIDHIRDLRQLRNRLNKWAGYGYKRHFRDVTAQVLLDAENL